MNSAKSTGKMVDHRTAKRKEWPAVVFVWMIGIGILSYMIGRVVLDAYPHPYHWASGLAGGVIGILVGWVWYIKRGDIF